MKYILSLVLVASGLQGAQKFAVPSTAEMTLAASKATAAIMRPLQSLKAYWSDSSAVFIQAVLLPACCKKSALEQVKIPYQNSGTNNTKQ